MSRYNNYLSFLQDISNIPQGTFTVHNTVSITLKAGSQYDTGTSVESQASG